MQTRVRRKPEPPPRLPEPTIDDRLDQLLVEWGEWVRSFRLPLGIPAASPAFKDVRCGIDWSIDAYSEVDTERFRTVNASIDDMLGPVGGLERWLVIHWNFAQGFRHKGPAVWRNARLPRFGSSDYAALLDAAKAAILKGLAKRNAMHLVQ